MFLERTFGYRAFFVFSCEIQRIGVETMKGNMTVLKNSISPLIVAVIAVLAFVRGKWLLPLLLLTFAVWGLYLWKQFPHTKRRASRRAQCETWPDEAPSDHPENPNYVPKLEVVVLYTHNSNSYWPEDTERKFEISTCYSTGKIGHSKAKPPTGGRKFGNMHKIHPLYCGYFGWFFLDNIAPNPQ